jgi:Holliday junction resolvase RusA-like endonuclease
MTTVAFTVPGKPVAQGSMRGSRNGFVRADNERELRVWRNRAAAAAADAWGDRPVLQGPVRVEVTFGWPRPRGHCRANGELKPSAPLHAVKGADADKLERALFDSLTGTVIADDRQVVEHHSWKVYADPVVTVVTIEEIA